MFAVGDRIAILEAHFEDETKEMKRINFNQLEKHLEEHRAFSAKIIHMIREYRGPSGDVSYELLYFLKDWGVKKEKKFCPTSKT